MSEPKSADPFDPANLRLPEDFLAGDENKKSKRTKVRRYHNRPRYNCCVFPLTLLDAMIEHRARWTVLAVVVALHELWFTHPNHNNPVHFTTYNLRRFGLSRHQKYRALDFLETIGQVAVERRSGKNPMVTLQWEAVRK
jgi:hypothetical protein